MPFLYHWTHKVNVPSIAEHGLLPSMATGKRQAVYLADAAQTHLLLAHVARHHGWPIEEMTRLAVESEDLSVKGTGLARRFYSDEVIPPDRIFVPLPGKASVVTPIHLTVLRPPPPRQ